MKSEEFHFLNQGIKFAGIFYSSEGQSPYPGIVVVHPASGGERTDPFYDHEPRAEEYPRQPVAAVTILQTLP